MCGICGFIGLDGAPAQEREVRNMMHLMRHRGPDDDGMFVADNVALGFVRLSILDLSDAGHQPMVSRNNRYVIVYNGEVYNYIELRAELKAAGYDFKSGTDTEVVLTAYDHWGESCLQKLNGMFAFVVYDRHTGKAVLVRDRFGVKPLYYTQVGQRLYFASEIRPLLSVMPRDLVTVNDQAVFDYLAYERVDLTADTFFANIRKLSHGNLMVVTNGRTRISRWYNLEERIGEPFAGIEAYSEALDSAVNLALRSDVPLGVSLSGGLDSSSIVSLLLKRLGMNNLHTFSAIYGKGIKGDESLYIEEFSPFLKNMNFVSPSSESLLEDLNDFVEAHQEPVPRTGPYAQYKVMQLAQGTVKVTLDGQGADEVMGGYNDVFGFFFKTLLTQRRYALCAREVYRKMGGFGAVGALTSGVYHALPAGVQNFMLRQAKRTIDSNFFRKHQASSQVRNLLLSSGDMKGALLDMVEHKLEHLLKWGDLNSMRFSIESRVPFLDYRLVEGVLGMPADSFIKNGYTKNILREATKGIVPETIRLRRDKVGFGTPENDWFRTPGFQQLVNDVLSSSFYKDYGYINRTQAQKAYKDHVSGKLNIARQIWKWINLQVWYKRFVLQPVRP